MTSENYRQLLNNEFEAKEMTKEDFDNTLMHFAMLYHTEQCAINGVVFNEADLCDDSCKYYCTKGFTQERECECEYPIIRQGYCSICQEDVK